ncbi:pyridoxamine 5'-phosphate oxidase family protein [Haloarcula sp. JP-L23]|uniref:pyridoxamine 5'-phosphate oxidase family protein n=1 Tax=Haloarcula sp. JP-L23 TaxID=2716717 RepID=UPI001D04FB52
MTPTDGAGDDAPTSSVRAAVAASTTAEFTTVRDGRPATVPVTPTYDPASECVVVSCAPAFAEKAARAAATPTVGLLLHGPDGPLHVTGTATVRDDDLEANAHRLRRLFEAEPPSEKRTAMLDAASVLQSRLGLLLLDWYGLRILIEIAPERIDRLDGTGAARVEAWPAADVDAGEAARYDRLVATAVDADGRPRTWPVDGFDLHEDALALSPPPAVSLVDGQPVCVLCHWHSAALDDLGQRVVRGRVRTVDGVPCVVPGSTARWRNVTALDALRFVVDGKRRTRRYFRARGETYRVVPRALLRRHPF